MTLQERIKLIQNELGITQKEFAKALQVPPGSITDWYKKGVTPRSDKIIRLVEIFSVNPCYLLKGDGYPFVKLHRWSEKDEIKLNDKYRQILYLINHYQKSDLVKGFYNTLKINNWREELDQKLGKLVFGGLYILAKRFDISPNILLVEAYSEFFYNIMKQLAQKKKISVEHFYILSEGCNYHSDDFQKVFPNNPLSYLSKKDLYGQINFQTRIKYKIYGLKEMTQEKKYTSNTAFLGIQQSFKQLDELIRKSEIPNFCEIDSHNYFYWSNCPICEKQIDSPSKNFEFDFPNIKLDEEELLENFVLEICERLSIMDKTKEELIENIQKFCN